LLALEYPERKRSNTCYSGGRARSREEEKQHMLLRREGSFQREREATNATPEGGLVPERKRSNTCYSGGRARSREEEKQHMLLRREGFISRSREEEKQLK
jgi:hypothetical protein